MFALVVDRGPNREIGYGPFKDREHAHAFVRHFFERGEPWTVIPFAHPNLYQDPGERRDWSGLEP